MSADPAASPRDRLPSGGVGSASDDGSPEAIEQRLWMLSPFLRMRSQENTPLVAEQVVEQALEDLKAIQLVSQPGSGPRKRGTTQDQVPHAADLDSSVRR